MKPSWEFWKSNPPISGWSSGDSWAWYKNSKDGKVANRFEQPTTTRHDEHEMAQGHMSIEKNPLS